MDLSITTDFEVDTGWPEPHLERIAAAGFTHIHWCHQWNTDFVYHDVEIEQVASWLTTFGLRLLDLHASAGKEKQWASSREYERHAGVVLVKNRIDFVSRVGSDVIVMHVPRQTDRAAWAQVRRSLDELEPYARSHRVRIAIENGDMGDIRELLAAYAPDYLGMCYDCGHGNTAPAGARATGLDQLEGVADRLIAVHLHDNDGTADQHRLPFTGTVDWERLARIMARSSYRKCVSMESNMHRETVTDPAEFLRLAYAAGARLTKMIAATS